MYTASALFLIAISALAAANDPCELPGELKTDPNHCDRFFQCTEDGWVSIQCQPKTRFNPKIMVCDWEKNVKCPKKMLNGVKYSSNDPCELPGELKADPNHCDRFFQCTEDGWVSIQCQPKTRFNPKIMVCDWEKNVKCPKKMLNGVKYSLEPCDNVGDLKADPKNCDRFYQCTNAGWASLQCQPPTVFNPEILRCDWDRNVHCRD